MRLGEGWVWMRGRRSSVSNAVFPVNVTVVILTCSPSRMMRSCAKAERTDNTFPNTISTATHQTKNPARAGLWHTLRMAHVLIFFVSVFIEEEFIFIRVVRPDLLDAFEGFERVLDFLQIVDNLQRSAGAYCIIN